MRSRLILVLSVFVALVASAPAQAAPGALNVLVTGNDGTTAADLATVIAAEPGVASATGFDTSVDTPAAASLAAYDLVVSIGDSSYFDAALWCDRLADYVDGGGAVLQTAYDNWNETDQNPGPTGRFKSGGYPPLQRGDNENLSVTLGALVFPDHPLVQGLGALPTTDNTTTPLAPGATLLARWSDDRNAIAVRNRVAAISASPGDAASIPGIARLARNTGNHLGRQNVNVVTSGTGVGTVRGDSVRILCGTVCNGVFAYGITIPLVAAPGKDSIFSGWTGPCSGTGPCSPTVAGSTLNVGAVFDKARFGTKTRVTISLLSRKVAGKGRIKLRIRNTNSFSVTGSFSGRSTSKTKLKAKRLSIPAKANKTVTLRLPESLRMTMIQQGELKLNLTAKLKDPAGKTRSVKKRVAVKPK